MARSVCNAYADEPGCRVPLACCSTEPCLISPLAKARYPGTRSSTTTSPFQGSMWGKQSLHDHAALRAAYIALMRKSVARLEPAVNDNTNVSDNTECNTLRRLSATSLPPLVDAPISAFSIRDLNDRRATSPTASFHSNRPPPSSFKPLCLHHLPGIQTKPLVTRCDTCYLT